MARTPDPASPDRRRDGLSPRLAAILRPELDSLAADIMGEVRRTIPVYAGSLEKAVRSEPQASVEQALRTFVDRISGSDDSRERRDELCRGLGRGEAYCGRSLDALQAAYRTGVQLAWRRVAEVGRRHRLSSAVMSQLADALFAYMDELVSLSVEGFEEARSRAGDPRAEARRLLLRVLLRRPRPTRAAVQRAAEAAGWSVPAEVIPLALPPWPEVMLSALEADVLADLDRAEPHLIIPGPLEETRLARLLAALPDRRGALGPAVPPTDSADSLRWARRTMALMDAGILADEGLARAEDHLLELWLLADQPLLHQLERRLKALDGVGAGQQRRLIETLGAWLESEGNAVETAVRLRVHPQTVRYRLRQITDAFGDRLADPDSRFALEAVLRAGRLSRRATAGGTAEYPVHPVTRGDTRRRRDGTSRDNPFDTGHS
jgi:hypothetical protein